MMLSNIRELFSRIFRRSKGDQRKRHQSKADQLKATPPIPPASTVVNATRRTENAPTLNGQPKKAQAIKQGSQQPLISAPERTTSSTLTVALCNRTTSNTVYAYITGLATVEVNGNSTAVVALLESDGQTVYYPENPPAIGSPLQANCAIPLTPSGETINCTIPQLAGGRIWFSINEPLTFLLNPSENGAALVEPSVTNPSDPNINIQWDFCEFTFNADQFYGDISYVDFACLPIALELQNSSGGVQNVTGMPPTGLASIVAGLQAQTATDGVQSWTNCIVEADGSVLRVLSPNSSLAVHPSDFQGYFEPYVSSVWKQYSATPLSINAQSVTTSGEVDTSSSSSSTYNQLVLPIAGVPTGTTTSPSGVVTTNPELFTPPSTADIFSCSTGPFATGSDPTRNAIIPQLASAFNRSTLLASASIPSPLSTFYGNPVTNHYARIVHSVNVDGKGYAFPYDDVDPVEGTDQSGEVQDASPVRVLVTVGGAQLE